MLILSVVYNSPYLGTLVSKDKFKKLLERTIGFLRMEAVPNFTNLSSRLRNS